MKTLKNWYQSKCMMSTMKKKSITTKKSLVIIIPDFESFNCNVLQDFVMINYFHKLTASLTQLSQTRLLNLRFWIRCLGCLFLIMYSFIIRNEMSSCLTVK